MPRRIPDAELLADVERVYEEIGEVPSEYQHEEHGQHHPSTLSSRFGTYTEAREKADIPNRDKRGGHNEISDEELKHAIQERVDELDRPPTRDEIDISEGPFRRAFGTWNDAIRAAGYDPPHDRNIDREEFTCANCGTTAERRPSQLHDDQNHYYCSEPCKYQHQRELYSGADNPNWQGGKVTVECAHCGGDLKRKPAQVEYSNYFLCDDDCRGKYRSENIVGEAHPRYKNDTRNLDRGPNWPEPQRPRRLERDNYECQVCGISAEEHRREYGEDIRVHHRRPVAKFHEEADGEPDFDEMNALDNLVTLCKYCHRMIDPRLPSTGTLGDSSDVDVQTDLSWF